MRHTDRAATSIIQSLHDRDFKWSAEWRRCLAYWKWSVVRQVVCYRAA